GRWQLGSPKSCKNDGRETVPVRRSDEPADHAPFELAVQFGNCRVSVLGTAFCRLDLSREELGAIMRDALYLVLDCLWKARQLVLTGNVPLKREPSGTPVDLRQIRPTPGAPFALGRTGEAEGFYCRICHKRVKTGERIYVGLRSHADCVDGASARIQTQSLAAVESLLRSNSSASGPR